MPEETERVIIAARAIARLEETHNKFLQSIHTNYADSRLEGGKLRIENGVIVAICLGVQLKIHHRIIVARDGFPSAIKYSFMAQLDDDYFSVFDMYLDQRQGALLKELNNPQSAICSYNNEQNLELSVLTELAESLLGSRIFSPEN